MGYGPLGGNLQASREHGKTPSVPDPGRNPPHRSQAARMNATLENRVDAGLSQAQGGKDSHCPSPGRLPPPFTSAQSLPLFPELRFPQGPIQARVMIKARIDEHFLCARPGLGPPDPCSHQILTTARGHGGCSLLAKLRFTEVRGPISRSRCQGPGD